MPLTNSYLTILFHFPVVQLKLVLDFGKSMRALPKVFNLIMAWICPRESPCFWKAFVRLLKSQKPVLFQGPFSKMNSRQDQQYSLLFDTDPVSYSIISNDAFVKWRVSPPLQGCAISGQGFGLLWSIILFCQQMITLKMISESTMWRCHPPLIPPSSTEFNASCKSGTGPK